MDMKKIVIIGAGFAGLAVAQRLSCAKFQLKLTIIDKKAVFDFLPILPDCLGRGINPRYLSYQLQDIAEKSGFQFIQDEVLALDVHHAIHENRQDDWRSNPFKVKKIKLAIKSVLQDDGELTEKTLELVKNQHEY